MHHDSKRRFDFSRHLLVVIAMTGLQKLTLMLTDAPNTFHKMSASSPLSVLENGLVGFMEWVFLKAGCLSCYPGC